MTTLFGGQIDYVYAIDGLAFFFLALVMLSSLGRTATSPLPWKWFGAAAVLHGLNIWAVAFSVSLGNDAYLEVARLALLAGSSLCLLQFARAGWVSLGHRRFSSWMFLPLVALAGLGAMAGVDGLNASIRYALGVPGGLWCAVVLADHARSAIGGKAAMRVAAAAMALLALAEYFVGAKASFVPASVLNRDSFLSATGFPVQLLGLVLAVVLLAALLVHYTALIAHEHPVWFTRNRPPAERVVAVALLMVILGGWVATEWSGKRAESRKRAQVAAAAVLAAKAISPRNLEHLSGTLADAGTVAYRHLRAQLVLMDVTNLDTRRLFLVVERGARFVWAVDSALPSQAGHTQPGIRYHPPIAGFANVFVHGGDVMRGPYADAHGTSVSVWASVRDPVSGLVVGVLGMDFNAESWASAVAAQRLPPILVTLLLALIMIGFLAVQDRMVVASLRLGESEQKYRSIIEDMQDVYFRTNVAGDLILVSPAAVHMFGGDSVEQAYRLNIGRDLYAEPKARAAFLQQLETSGAARDFEAVVKRMDGTQITVSVNSHYYRDTSGNVLGVEGVARDITEQTRVHVALADAEEQSRLLLQSAGDGIFGVDVHGSVTFMNVAAEQMLGWSADELQGRQMHAAIHYARADGSDYPIALCPQFAAYSRGLESHVEDEVFWRKDGSSFPVEYMSRPILKNGALSGAIVTFRDVAERKKNAAAVRSANERTRAANRELRVLARVDSLTGIVNRRTIVRRLDKEMARARREGVALSVGMLDIDRFKRVNDTGGHAAGDVVLRAVVERAQSVLRPYDILGRFGGEEFLVIVPGAEGPEAREVFERICTAVRQSPISSDGREFAITVSLGGATTRGEPLDDLLVRVDDALYLAKDQGRNRVVMAGPVQNGAEVARPASA